MDAYLMSGGLIPGSKVEGPWVNLKLDLIGHEVEACTDNVIPNLAVGADDNAVAESRINSPDNKVL
jgi:hypothetical protein